MQPFKMMNFPGTPVSRLAAAMPTRRHVTEQPHRDSAHKPGGLQPLQKAGPQSQWNRVHPCLSVNPEQSTLPWQRAQAAYIGEQCAGPQKTLPIQGDLSKVAM